MTKSDPPHGNPKSQVVSAQNLPLVLKYWQSVLRQEEILGTRPRARKVQHAATLTSANVAAPSGAQDYVKVPFDLALPLLTTLRGQVSMPVTGECGAFFETWLAAQYRRADDIKREYLAAFPTLLLPRSELAGLLRTGVGVEWRSAEGKAFQAPTAAQRAKKHIPEPPTEMRVTVVAGETDELPFFVDTRVLRDVLRIEEERISQFLSEQKAQKPSASVLIERLCELLHAALDGEFGEESPNDGGQGLLRRLSRLTALRLKQCRSSAQVFEVALVLDASRNRTTYHVQRDIQAALDLHEVQGLDEEQPLTMYVGAAVAPQAHRTLLGRYGERGLTASQRQAGERCLGSTLCAVQGPPGTGKTHLILSLAAHQLVANVLPLCEVLQPLAQLLVVTSTNNRAVDNVITPLCNDLGPNRLPLALRVGSREIVEKVTASELSRAQRWLERQKNQAPQNGMRRANKQPNYTPLCKVHSSPALAHEPPRTLWPRPSSSWRLWSGRRPTMRRMRATSNAEPPFNVDMAVVREHASLIVAHCTALVIRLRALSELSAPDKRTALRALEQHFKLSTQRHVTPLEDCLEDLPLPLGLPLPISNDADATEQRPHGKMQVKNALSMIQRLEATASAFQSSARRTLRHEALVRDVATLQQKLAAEVTP